MNQIIELYNNTLKIQIKNYNIEKLEPILELYKGKLYLTLIKHFINDCTHNFGTQIFSIKKSYSRTLTNILSSWIFSLYIDYDFSGDFFLPSKYDNTLLLETILKDLCKYDITINNVDGKINNIITNLKKNYANILVSLDEYKKSQIYKNNMNKYKINKSLICFNKNTNNIVFYKFSITYPFVIKDKRLFNILDNILLPSKLYDKLSSVYSGPSGKVDEYLWGIIFRYQLLGSNNHQLAVLPNIIKEMNKDYGLSFECFASTINSTFPHYCSIYYDLEKYFGSVGSFFNMVPLKGTFGFNPPYQKDVIELGTKKLFNFLETEEELSFIITIPIWDLIGRKAMKEKYNNELEKQNIDYGDFEIINEMKQSKYFRGLRMISKDEFTYIDHNFELYKNKTIQNTYVIFLSNKDINIEHLEKYNFFN
jgi:hypothetical protein